MFLLVTWPGVKSDYHVRGLCCCWGCDDVHGPCCVMSVVHAASREHVDVYGLCSHRRPCWCPWFVLLLKAIWMTVVWIATWSHVDIHSLCCHLEPWWCPGSTLQPWAVLISEVCTPAGGHDGVPQQQFRLDCGNTTNLTKNTQRLAFNYKLLRTVSRWLSWDGAASQTSLARVWGIPTLFYYTETGQQRNQLALPGFHN